MKTSTLTITIFCVLAIAFPGFCMDYYVDAENGSNDNTGLSPEEAFRTITYPLALLNYKNNSIETVTIHVAAGHYTYYHGEVFPIKLLSNVNLIGAGSEKTFINALDRDPDDPSLNPSEKNDIIIGCWDVENVLIRGFTLEHGQFGIDCVRSSVEVDDCRIRHIYYYFPDFLAYRISSYAVYISNSDVRISNSIVNSIGGGNGEPNYALFVNTSSPKVVNCLFVNNVRYYDSIIYCQNNSFPHFINCTISNNPGLSEAAGVVESKTGSVPKFTNCIIWNNGFISISGNAVASYSNIFGDYFGEGNISVDPVFVSLPGSDDLKNNFYLSPDSPCIDAGSPIMTFGLDRMTTQTNRKRDTGRIDIGFHYFIKLGQ